MDERVYSSMGSEAVNSMATSSYRNYTEYLDFKAGRMARRPKGGTISPRAADLLREYLDDYATENGVAASTLMVHTAYLISFAQKVGGDLESFDTRDVKKVFGSARRDMKPNSQRKFIWNAKRLCEWLYDQGINTEIDVGEIKKVREPPRTISDKKPDDMLTDVEIRAMVDACRSSRDRAIISVMFEGALRACEVTRLTWRDLKEDERGIVLFTNEKTKKMRRIRLHNAVPYIRAWKADYPGTSTGNNRVFLSSRGDTSQLSYQALKKVLYTASKRAGVTDKRIHCHLLRHSRITEMLEQRVSESVIKMVAWGSINSPMLATYGHLSDEFIDDDVLTGQGVDVVPIKRRDSVMKAVQCPKCSEIARPGAAWCDCCGAPLTEEAARSVDSVEDRLRRLADADRSSAEDIIDMMVRKKVEAVLKEMKLQ